MPTQPIQRATSFNIKFSSWRVTVLHISGNTKQQGKDARARASFDSRKTSTTLGLPILSIVAIPTNQPLRLVSCSIDNKFTGGEHFGDMTESRVTGDVQKAVVQGFASYLRVMGERNARLYVNLHRIVQDLVHQGANLEGKSENDASNDRIHCALGYYPCMYPGISAQESGRLSVVSSRQQHIESGIHPQDIVRKVVRVRNSSRVPNNFFQLGWGESRVMRRASTPTSTTAGSPPVVAVLFFDIQGDIARSMMIGSGTFYSFQAQCRP
ncbi:hypothetical protein IW262DRAFT_1299372 [Armillaria fumosa]|nr:hypothetical protein IW262DRAFT_1299372 [Armillaria fumosa]